MKKHKLEMIVTMIESESTNAIVKELKEAIESGEFHKSLIGDNDDILGVEATFTELE